MVLRNTIYFGFLAGIVFLANAFVQMWPNGHILMRGTFHQVTHKGSGEARIYRLPDGSLELAIRSFRTSYIPRLNVMLIASADAPNNEVVLEKEHLDLGQITSVVSAWNTALPAALDLNRFRAIAVWSPRYQVNVTAAALLPLAAGKYRKN